MVTKNSVYRFETPDDLDSDLDGALFEVVDINRHDFDPDNTTIEVEPVGDRGEWATHYLDVFEGMFTFVAPSREDL